MKAWIAKYLVKPFKSLNCFGRQRFWLLYWAYKLTGWHIRHKEWDFVLEYLPALRKWQTVRVLDVGCSRNLLCHEVVSRGYKLIGIDLEEPSFKYPGTFYEGDIRDFGYPRPTALDFVLCISVLEHIEGETGQQDAIKNMFKSLKIGGRLLLTVPTHEFAQGHPWHGFSFKDIYDLLPPEIVVKVDATERAGQLCMAFERIK